MESELRRLPSVDRLLLDDRIKQLSEVFPRHVLVDLIRQRLEEERFLIIQGKPCVSADYIVKSISARAESLAHPGPSRVVNATGVMLHTNLGRAPLSQEAVAAMSRIAGGYCDLEFDLASGLRGSRQTHCENLLCQLTGAEAALAVNNNASALLLALTALTRKKEVIVSRGQAVEIGGGFRIPDVMRQSGAKLVEVGTTNCTYAGDYEQAISPRTAALLRVHSSNFKVVGFTHGASIEEMVTLGKRCSIPVFDDLGSGCLLDTTAFGLDPEPMVQRSIALGASLVFFSGDKLLGGPQAGIIVGDKSLVDKLKKHPLARAVRIDKVSLAGLVATLLHYLKGEAATKVPVWRMISTPGAEIERRAAAWARVLGNSARVTDGETMIGGGSLPGSTLPTRVVSVEGDLKGKAGGLAQTLARKLRSQDPPVVGRISGNALLLDPRSVLPEEDRDLTRALRNIIKDLKP